LDEEENLSDGVPQKINFDDEKSDEVYKGFLVFGS